MVRMADYPQLRCIAWSRRPDGAIAAKDALVLHEKQLELVDQTAVDDDEKALIDRLACEVSHGSLV